VTCRRGSACSERGSCRQRGAALPLPIWQQRALPWSPSLIRILQFTPVLGPFMTYWLALSRYDALDPGTQEQIASLSAFHSNLIGSTRVLPQEHQAALHALVGDNLNYGPDQLEYQAPLRPLVKYHPVTRRPMLCIGRHSFGVTGMEPEESERFLQSLEDDACQSPRVYEHTWELGQRK
jgi:alpha-ketoglutarate-dependent taurine dioxygenase